MQCILITYHYSIDTLIEYFLLMDVVIIGYKSSKPAKIAAEAKGNLEGILKQNDDQY